MTYPEPHPTDPSDPFNPQTETVRPFAITVTPPETYKAPPTAAAELQPPASSAIAANGGLGTNETPGLDTLSDAGARALQRLADVIATIDLTETTDLDPIWTLSGKLESLLNADDQPPHVLPFGGAVVSASIEPGALEFLRAADAYGRIGAAIIADGITKLDEDGESSWGNPATDSDPVHNWIHIDGEPLRDLSVDAYSQPWDNPATDSDPVHNWLHIDGEPLRDLSVDAYSQHDHTAIDSQPSHGLTTGSSSDYDWLTIADGAVLQRAKLQPTVRAQMTTTNNEHSNQGTIVQDGGHHIATYPIIIGSGTIVRNATIACGSTIEFGRIEGDDTIVGPHTIVRSSGKRNRARIAGGSKVTGSFVDGPSRITDKSTVAYSRIAGESRIEGTDLYGVDAVDVNLNRTTVDDTEQSLGNNNPSNLLHRQTLPANQARFYIAQNGEINEYEPANIQLIKGSAVDSKIIRTSGAFDTPDALEDFMLAGATVYNSTGHMGATGLGTVYGPGQFHARTFGTVSDKNGEERSNEPRLY